MSIVTDPKGNNKTVAYDHWKETTIDEKGSIKRKFFNAANLISKVEEVLGATTSATMYTYNARDELTQIVDDKSNVFGFTYDTLGRKTAQSDPDMGNWSYGYDGVGNLTSVTDARNITVTRTYDELNRLLTVNYPTDTDLSFLYDSGKIGALSIATDSAGTVNYAYDNRLRKIAEARTINGTTKTTQWAYDALDRITSQINPDSTTASYTFNSQGEIESLTDIIDNFDYNALGKITKKDFANGVSTNYTYNNDDFRLNRIQTGSLFDKNYTYDEVGNIKSIANNLTSKTETFTYDDLDRLKSATESAGYNYAYEYNSIGNLTKFTNSGIDFNYTYGSGSAKPHALTASGSATFTYDANGNMTLDGEKLYEYNEANQLKKVKLASNSATLAEYVYDYNGLRMVKKNYTGGTLNNTVYSWSDSFETKVIEGGATETTVYYFANNELIAKKKNDASKEYIHTDHLGSTSVVTNQAGSIVEATSYDPWGEVLSGGTQNKFQYTGQEMDAETGLNYYGARYYNSDIRRFTQADPEITDYHNPQDLNRYSYVRNNPLRYTDPTGNHPLLIMAAVGAGIGAAAGYAEVRLTNPDATLTDYAKAMSVGAVAGAGGAVAGVYAAGATAALLAGPGVSTGALSLTSNIIGGMASGAVSNAIKNKFDNKSLTANLKQAIALGGVTGGVTSKIAQALVPAGKGPVPQLNLSISPNVGPNTFRTLDRFTLDTGLNSLINIPLNVNAAKSKPTTNSKQPSLLDKLFNFFGKKK